MTPEAIEKLCEEARKRLLQFINRSTAQHIRAMRNNWKKS